jgi:glycosyltransferase involved in cell wall biosynthesis
MRIAFHAPMKAPDHPVPSGDRQMARLLMRALAMAGHEVELASRLRAYSREPAPLPDAAPEIARLGQGAKPDLWFTYHPYYKAPDLLGPPLCRQFGIPYVTAEASYAGKRDLGPWAARQVLVVDAIRLARRNISFTERDREGLLRVAAAETCVLLPPFIDIAPFAPRGGNNEEARLVTVAMMRPGDKLQSYAFLAQALALLSEERWHLTVIGDGPARDAVTDLLPKSRVSFLGEKPPEDIPGLLVEGDLYVWPGCGEAFGLAYLEAEAAGLPVVAQATAGVPSVVRHGETGLLTPEGDVAAYADAMRRLIRDRDERRRLSDGARRLVEREHSLDAAARRLDQIVMAAVRQ